MLSDPVAEAFGLIHRHPSGENLWYGMDTPQLIDGNTERSSGTEFLRQI